LKFLPHYLVLAAILIISSGWCVTAGRQLGATFDEPLYLRAGLAFWHNAGGNDLVLLRGTMPLPQDVDALFLRIAEYIQERPGILNGILHKCSRLRAPEHWCSGGFC
jgi:hypothetical protein